MAKNSYLLPAGFKDKLPPDAGGETALTARFLSVFSRFGYEEASPPLIEFEDSIFSGLGKPFKNQSFRVMDPLSHKMMGIRPDITIQIARIVESRLSGGALPLRICYAGEILKTKPTNLHAERQLRQAGLELVGTRLGEPTAHMADAEVIIVAAEALEEAGIRDLRIDLNIPDMLDELLSGEDLKLAGKKEIRLAVNKKDISSLGILPLSPETRATLSALMESSGVLDEALKSARKLKLGRKALDKIAYIEKAAGAVREAKPGITLTADFVENRGFDYHLGLGFSVFAGGFKEELGRGGRYAVSAKTGLEATGFTFYLNSITRNLSPAAAAKKILVPSSTPLPALRKLHGEGFITIQSLSAEATATEAKRLGCGFALNSGRAKEI